MTESTLTTEFSNIADFIEATLKRFAEKPAFTCLGQTFTYNDIEQKSRALASWFQQQENLNVGDRIVIQLPNLIQYPIAVYAAFRAGLIVVNTNPLYTAREMKHQFIDSGAKAIVILADLLPKLDAIKAETEIEYVIATSAQGLLTGIDDVPESCYSLNKIFTTCEHSTLALRPVSKADDICLLQYTGGTTGVAKGASLTHQSLLANAQQTRIGLGKHYQGKEQIFICPLPLYHIYAFSLSHLLLFGDGNLSVLIPNPRDLDVFIKTIAPVKFTGFSGLNTLFLGLCMKPEFKALDFSNLKLTVSGGTALMSSAMDTWQQVTGCTISEGYGLSETSPVVCLNEPGKEVLGTVGKPLIGTDVQLRDELGRIADEGEIVIRGPQVMKGYWNRLDATAEVMTDDGYFRTGDIGFFDENGNVKIIDRLKDMIIVSGFNVYPNEIEDVLSSFPDVIESAVIGEPNDKTGEQVTAFVVCEKATSEDALVNYCRDNLTPYKVPKRIEFVDQLPKSAVGKILRKELRK